MTHHAQPAAPPRSPLHQAALHESGALHASGEASYVDDIPTPAGTLVGWVVASPVARGRITRLDVSAASALPGVACVLTARDITGINDISAFAHDEPLFAADEVFCIGQAVAVIFGESAARCREAARAVVLEIEALEPILTIQQAIAKESWLGTPHTLRRGDASAALEAAPLRLSGTVETGGQDHFYLESQCALAVPQEAGTFQIFSSTQHPSEVQAKCAEILGISRHLVTVEARRMGGGFGGKETQGAHFAAMATLGARATRRPCKVWLNRDQDMIQTGKRHPFFSTYDVGFSQDGDILALEVDIYANAGWATDLSPAILDRALFHLDNAYSIPNLRFTGRCCRTDLVSNTAFRGFGGPQGVAVIEHCMNVAAERLGLDYAEIRSRNYYGAAPRDQTPYHQQVIPEDNRLQAITDQLLQSSDYAARREAIDAFNAQSPWVKRGLGFQPVKFGISFTTSMLNQAGAFVVIYADGSVQLNHGGTEMGQGLHTKMLAICAHELGVSLDQLRMMPTATDKVPNTSATAASSGADLNGMAVLNACQTLRARLVPVAAELLGLPEGAPITFCDGRVFPQGAPERAVAFSAVTTRAYVQQISLSATGFYRTPNIHYDREAGRGKPFHYYAYGAAITEIELNALTGEHRVTRADILHDVGDSLVPTIDVGQIEGAYIQGLGWVTREELIWDDKGLLRTHSPDTYKIPAYGDTPLDLRVQLLQNAPQHNVVHGSKAVGEPPFMLAIGAITALRHAISSFAPPRAALHLAIPATPEAVLRAVEAARCAS